MEEKTYRIKIKSDLGLSVLDNLKQLGAIEIIAIYNVSEGQKTELEAIPNATILAEGD